MDEEENILSNNYQKYAKNLEFKYCGQVTAAMMMNLHNLEGFVQIKYKREYPLDLVITEQSIQKYNKIFFSILRVKKVSLLLKDCWKNLTSIEFKRLPRQHESQVR